MSCPDDNTLVAVVEHELGATAFAELEIHIDSCDCCRQIISLAVGTAPDRDEVKPPGAINNRYVIDAVLGRGGMGTVYLARDLSLGRSVALKLHRVGSGNDRLHREAIAMAKLAHPNVVTVFEAATVDDRLYVAMEYVRGETLRGWLGAAPRSWRAIVEVLLQSGEGLAAAHAAGLVHRDFKPENVLVGDDGRARVGDFGLARVGGEPSVKPLGLARVGAENAIGATPFGLGAEASRADALGATPCRDATMSMTQAGAVMGTPAYMAPEQLAGSVVDARTDQFAFCVVAWECLFGKRPYVGPTMAALEDAMHRGELHRPARSDVPRRIREVLERGLAIAAAERYPDMAALLAALRAGRSSSRNRCSSKRRTLTATRRSRDAVTIAACRNCQPGKT